MNTRILTLALFLTTTLGCAYHATELTETDDHEPTTAPDLVAEFQLDVSGLVWFCPIPDPTPDPTPTGVCPELTDCANVEAYLADGADMLFGMVADSPEYTAFKACMAGEVAGCTFPGEPACPDLNECSDWPEYLAEHGPPLEELDPDSAGFRHRRDCLLGQYEAACCAEANPDKCISHP